MTTGRRRMQVVAALLVGLALVLSGCSEEARDDIRDFIADNIGGGSGSETPTEEPVEPTEEPAEPTEEAAATEEPVEPTEEPAEPSEAESVVEEPVDDGGVPLWVWLLAAVLLVLLVVALVGAGRRRNAATARRDRLRDTAIAEADWLLGAARERAASVDAASRARDVRLRLDRLTDALQQVRSGARDQAAVAASDLQTSARQLADALVARLDDAASHREEGSLGIDELADRVRDDRDTFATALGRDPRTG